MCSKRDIRMGKSSIWAQSHFDNVVKYCRVIPLASLQVCLDVVQELIIHFANYHYRKVGSFPGGLTRQLFSSRDFPAVDLKGKTFPIKHYRPAHRKGELFPLNKTLNDSDEIGLRLSAYNPWKLGSQNEDGKPTTKIFGKLQTNLVVSLASGMVWFEKKNLQRNKPNQNRSLNRLQRFCLFLVFDQGPARCGLDLTKIFHWSSFVVSCRGNARGVLTLSPCSVLVIASPWKTWEKEIRISIDNVI